MRLLDTRFFTKNATTKRASIVDGKRGQRTDYLTFVKVSPIEPIDIELQRRLGISGASQFRQCYVEDGSLDIKRNDSVVIDSVEYVIRGLDKWDGSFRKGMGDFMVLALEEVIT